MSTYVMSDIHGCYDEFIEMLKKIEFSNKDKLIIAGDYMDRGTQSYEMLKWIENKPNNVILLKGNHDEEFAYCIDLMKMLFDKKGISLDNLVATKLIYELIKGMSIDGDESMAIFDYYGTIQSLIYDNSVTMEQLIKWSNCIREMPLVYRDIVNERNIIVVR